MALTIGELRAAIADQPDHITLALPIPASTIDGGQGDEYADITGINIAGDTADIEYDRPDAWSLNGATERAQYREDRKYAASYLAASNHAVAEAVRMPLEVRLNALLDDGIITLPDSGETAGVDPKDFLDALVRTLHEDITVGLAGAAARHLPN